MEAKESPGSEHAGTQKEPMQFAQREEWGDGTAFTCLISGRDAARSLFLVRIGIGNRDSEQLISETNCATGRFSPCFFGEIWFRG